MMKKRSNENSQLRPEEVDRLDEEESEEMGTFQKASADEMAGRRIVRVKKRNTEAGEAPKANAFASFSAFSSAPAASSVPTSNPFAGFSSLAPAASTSTAAAVPSSGTFAGFSFAAAPAAASTTTTVAKPPSAALAAPKEEKVVSGGDKNESEYQKKVKKLNQTFLGWAERQIKENAIAVWKDGVKDYIKYQKALKEKYPQDAAAQEAAVALKAKDDKAVKETQKIEPAKNDKAEEPKSSSASGSSLFFSKPATAADTNKTTPAAPFAGFGATPAAAPASAPAPAFSLPAAPSFPPAPASTAFSFPTTTSFSFPTSSAAAATAAAPAFGSGSASFPSFGAASGGFGGFGQPSSFGQPVAAKKEEGGDEEGGDDEGEPILEPEKILRNENDRDEILIEVNCKLMYFNKEDKEWKDKGKGSFRLTKDPDSSKKRMLVRNTMGKITFNAAFYKGMKIEKHKDSLLFNAFVAADEGAKPEFQRFTLKFKSGGGEADSVKSLLEKCVAELN